jgi:hypothetical protein
MRCEVSVGGLGSVVMMDGFVCIRWVVLWRGMNAIEDVVGESTIALGDRRVCVEVV